MTKTTHGGKREGAGRKPLERQITTMADVDSASTAELEREYVDGRSRGVLMSLLSDGEAHPFEIIFKTMRHFNREAENKLDLADRLPEGEDNDRLRDKLTKDAGDLMVLAAKHAEKVLPYAYPKLASIDHTGAVAPAGPKIGTINVILQGAIDRLSSQAGKGRDLLEALTGGAGTPDLRLGLLEQTGTASPEAQPPAA